MKRKNGISIYPNDESIENIKEYLKLAGQLNYQYVFNSLHMPEFSIEQMLNFLKEVSMIVHDLPSIMSMYLPLYLAWISLGDQSMKVYLP